MSAVGFHEEEVLGKEVGGAHAPGVARLGGDQRVTRLAEQRGP